MATAQSIGSGQLSGGAAGDADHRSAAWSAGSVRGWSVAGGQHLLVVHRLAVQQRAGLNADTIVVVLGVAARAQATCAQSGEHGTYQLAETGRIHGL